MDRQAIPKDYVKPWPVTPNAFMPDPERLLRTLARATAAFRGTLGRIGRVVRLTDVGDVVVAGDLHGHVGNFQAVMKRADLGNHPHRHLVLQEVVHGPFRYPQGGDKSHQLLDLTAALTVQYSGRVHFLPGNHELAQASNRAVGKGDTDYNVLFREGVRSAYGDRCADVYAAYMELIAAAPLAVRTPNRVFISHSLPSAAKMAQFAPADLERDSTPDDLTPAGSVYALVWGRDTSAANVERFLAMMDADLLITGHVPCDAGFWAPNGRHLILDSMDAPAGFVLFPADRPLTHAELMAGVGVL